jgi:TRAP-type transport system periplasmic protein
VINRRQMLMAMAGATLATPSAARAEVTWDMPTPYTDGTFHTENIRWFVQQLAKASGNGIRITVHSNNTLIRGPEILRAVSSGQVAAGEILISQFGNEEPTFELDAIPFLAQGFEQAKALSEASRAAVEAALQKRGVRALYMVPWPSQAFYSKTPINTVADMRGMKFRTGSPMTSRMAELLEAVPTVVQGSDIPQAFATNMVTGMVTSAVTGVQSRAWEFATHFINVKVFMPKNAVIVNEREWRRLPDDVKATITTQGGLAETRGWELAAKAETDAVEELRRHGMVVSEPPADLNAAVRAVGQRLAEEWQAKAGSVGKQIIEAYRSRVKA